MVEYGNENEYKVSGDSFAHRHAQSRRKAYLAKSEAENSLIRGHNRSI